MKLRKQARMINAVCWRLSPLALVIGTGLFPGVLHAENYFNPAFLADGKNQVADLSRFENDGSQAPGIYRVDIYLNNDFITSHDVEFQARQTQNSSAPSSSDGLC
ncbi:FimD/PapC N-terminal domain-containing protein [Enterobacter asburiae]|uniref:FimD/PapC N-terminal domain-containing protein n=1 Tax=Enterobacter asburiae TaxID=61645 RepID=UPI00298C6306|nr:FimD/PapC N-terminal domain-containing protein [Enterobacter asburiae]